MSWYKYFGKQERKKWKAKNLKLLQDRSIEYERLSPNAVRIKGFVFDLYSGDWHKQGKGLLLGRGLCALLKRIKQEEQPT